MLRVASPPLATATTDDRASFFALPSMSNDDAGPSDYDLNDLSPVKKTVAVDLNDDDARIRDELKRELLLLSSVTNRGEFASREERDIFIDLITQLEAMNPTVDPALHCEGDWELCCTNTQAFRSSPFFMAIRSVLDPNMARNAFDIHARATSVSQIGRVRQSISKDSLVSEVNLDVGVFPGIPIKIKGTVITEADLTMIAPEKHQVRIQKTKVKGSNIPFLDQYLDDYPIQLPVGETYERFMGSVPVSTMKTFYVDEGLRITRDEDDNYFVFVRA